MRGRGVVYVGGGPVFEFNEPDGKMRAVSPPARQGGFQEGWGCSRYSAGRGGCATGGMGSTRSGVFFLAHKRGPKKTRRRREGGSPMCLGGGKTDRSWRQMERKCVQCRGVSWVLPPPLMGIYRSWERNVHPNRQQHGSGRPGNGFMSAHRREGGGAGRGRWGEKEKGGGEERGKKRRQRHR